MAVEVRIDPAGVAALAKATIDASAEFMDAWRMREADFVVPPDAFGPTATAASVHKAHAIVAGDLGMIIGRLVAVYESDVDNLYQAAARYQKADDAAAAEIRRQARVDGPI